MTTPPMPPDPERDAYISALLDRAAAIRLPELFQGDHPDSLWLVRDRHGVSTVVMRTTSLTREQLVAIMTYRLAQNLMAHQLDARQIYEHRVQQETLGADYPSRPTSLARDHR